MITSDLSLLLDILPCNKLSGSARNDLKRLLSTPSVLIPLAAERRLRSLSPSAKRLLLTYAEKYNKLELLAQLMPMFTRRLKLDVSIRAEKRRDMKAREESMREAMAQLAASSKAATFDPLRFLEISEQEGKEENA